MYKIEVTFAELNFEEWNALEKIFNDTEYCKTICELRKKENEPTKAISLFSEKNVSHGHERINIILRKKNMPFRLTRIGPWIKGEKREDRLLAFVRWSEEHLIFHTKKIPSDQNRLPA